MTRVVGVGNGRPEFVIGKDGGEIVERGGPGKEVLQHPFAERDVVAELPPLLGRERAPLFVLAALLVYLALESLQRQRADDGAIPVVHRREVIDGERVVHGAIEIEHLRRDDGTWFWRMRAPKSQARRQRRNDSISAAPRTTVQPLRPI